MTAQSKSTVSLRTIAHDGVAIRIPLLYAVGFIAHYGGKTEW